MTPLSSQALPCVNVLRIIFLSEKLLKVLNKVTSLKEGFDLNLLDNPRVFPNLCLVRTCIVSGGPVITLPRKTNVPQAKSKDFNKSVTRSMRC